MGCVFRRNGIRIPTGTEQELIMNKKELIKIIELVVRKEVKKQVNEIFIKENKSSLKSLTEKEFKEPIPKLNLK